jgi:hypothetical protein
MFFKNKEKKLNEKAIVLCQRDAAIEEVAIKAAFGSDVIIIYTDKFVENGIKYLGVQTD